ncbi:hypothetical protein ACXYRQ_03610 [Mycoplasma sp. 394]
MVDNSHGYKNESLIVELINGKRIKDLSIVFKHFIEDICLDNNLKCDSNTKVFARLAEKEKDNQSGKKVNTKIDIFIYIDSRKFSISTKIGSAIVYIKNQLVVLWNESKHLL